jgi:hypothetical protein
MQAAQLCEACGVGPHKNESLHCGEALSGGAIVAQLCSSCYSVGKDKYIKCNKPLFDKSVPARLCGRCGFSPAGNRCGKVRQVPGARSSRQYLILPNPTARI